MTVTVPTRQRILDAAQELILEYGFSATTVDKVLEAAGVSKGAFFHYFSSKQDLGRTLLERYAEADQRLLESFMEAAEASTDDPAGQVLAFVRGFEDAARELFAQPGCLFVSFIYERIPESRPNSDIIAGNVQMWRDRLMPKLQEAVRAYPPAVEVDLPSLADQVFTIFEGAFILARATGEADRVRAQLVHLRRYLELLFGQPAV